MPRRHYYRISFFSSKIGLLTILYLNAGEKKMGQHDYGPIYVRKLKFCSIFFFLLSWLRKRQCQKRRLECGAHFENPWGKIITQHNFYRFCFHC